MEVYAFGVVLAMALLAGGANGAGNCGEKKMVVQQLISNGHKAVPVAGAWPWHGAMFHRNGLSTTYKCGVTILSEQVVLTAAHCTIDPTGRERIPAKRIFVRIGVTNLDSRLWHVQQHDVRDVIRHEGYNEVTLEDDIALLKLNTEIAYNNFVQPICLWQGNTKLSEVESKVGFIVGWGYNELNELSQDLNEASMPIVSKRECINSDPDHYTKFYFDPKTFCAGYRNGTQAAAGDSGGGFFLRFGRHWVLRGIISNAKVDPNTLKVEAASFVVFIDVAFYTDWIKSKVLITTSFAVDIGAPASSGSSGGSESHTNLLAISNCGIDRYSSGTPEEMKGYYNQYPWLAVIEYINTNTRALEDTCHGVLIHASFLVTVIQCVQKKGLSRIYSVRLNDYQLNKDNAIRIAVRGVSIHPSNDIPKYANNIALIKLERPTTVNPICLSLRSSTLPRATRFSIVGWKKNSRNKKPMIRNVVQLADFGACQRKYAEENIFLDATGGHVCSTYSHDDDSGSCSHYMGSAPFQYVRDDPFKGRGRYFLAAISSFGHTDCRRIEFPDVFTNVAHYADWILQKVRANEGRSFK